jgi:hypothetical protein
MASNAHDRPRNRLSYLMKQARGVHWLLGGPYEHGVHEQRVVGPRTDDAHLDRLIPAGEPIKTVNPVADIQSKLSNGMGERQGNSLHLSSHLAC